MHRQQLAHFLAHLESTEGWTIPVDRPLVERMTFELGEALFDAITQAQQNRQPPAVMPCALPALDMAEAA